MKYLTLAALLLASTSEAQEVPPPQMMFISGGMLCNTMDELHVMLTEIALHDNAMPPVDKIPEGCGRFSPRSPIPMMVTPLAWYETTLATALIAEFVYPGNGWTQYGWVAFEMSPTVESSGLPL